MFVPGFNIYAQKRGDLICLTYLIFDQSTLNIIHNRRLTRSTGRFTYVCRCILQLHQQL